MSIRVGLCGFGNMAKGHSHVLPMHPDVSVVAVADRCEENRRLAAEAFGCHIYETGQELIMKEDLDVVFVVVPTYLHKELTLMALQKGCHVLCEKPMALNPEDCKEMTEAAKKAGKFLMVGQVLHFWPEYVYLKDLIQTGVYGKLLALSMTRIGKVSIGWERWFLDESRGGMQIFDRHIHDSDVIQWILGMPKSVYSYGFSRDPQCNGGIAHSFTEYYYNDDMVVSAEGSADTGPDFPFTAMYRAHFENAVVEFNSRNKPNTVTVFAGAEPFYPEMPNLVETEITSGLNIKNAGPYFAEEVYFFECVRKGIAPVTVTPEGATDTIRLVKAEIESVRTKQRIFL